MEALRGESFARKPRKLFPGKGANTGDVFNLCVWRGCKIWFYCQVALRVFFQISRVHSSAREVQHIQLTQRFNKWSMAGRLDPTQQVNPELSGFIFYDSSFVEECRAVPAMKSSFETNSKRNKNECEMLQHAPDIDYDVKHTIKVNSLLQEGFWFLMTLCAVAKEHRHERNNEERKSVEGGGRGCLRGLFICSDTFLSLLRASIRSIISWRREIAVETGRSWGEGKINLIRSSPTAACSSTQSFTPQSRLFQLLRNKPNYALSEANPSMELLVAWISRLLLTFRVRRNLSHSSHFDSSLMEKNLICN